MAENIKIALPDGSVKEYPSGITPLGIAESISVRLSQEALVASINGNVMDINTAITSNTRIKIHTFNDAIGQEAYWHSSSHLLAHAVKELFPEAKFGVGPAIESGFYYDIDIETKLSEDDLPKIEAKISELTKQGNSFQRQELSKQDALEFFTEKKDEYKLELIDGLDEKNVKISIYHEGTFTDLCTGPHIPSTDRVKYVKLLSVSGSYWRGDEKNKQLQRIYGISFPKKKMLDEHLERLEEAKRRDHRKLGKELELFHITQKVGPGLPLWLPKGAVLRETLENFLREEQVKRGYLPVITPHIGNINLYKTSGHYPYYKDSQFPTMQLGDNEEYLLKPMNCPHHFQIYDTKVRSYKDLPIRYSEFGTVYRYEQSGELNGLTRVRCFSVDDSHMFVRQDQLKDEICDVIDLIQTVFAAVGFEDFSTELSFRDDNEEKYGGDIELWNKAQTDLKAAADLMKLNYTIQEGEAAFYGPKIDFIVRDVLGRKWQLGTVQVDYVMPERFDLNYIGSDGQKHRPVVIHRAPFGSLERFIGVLIEHFGGAFPVWLAPVQAAVIPISQNFFDYAKEIVDKLKSNGIRVEYDQRNEKIGYKIRDWETQKVPFMLVVGEKERESGTVSLRQHKVGDRGSMKIEQFIDEAKNLIDNKINNN
ncbi:MAG: threonine--tRNA ligase [Bacteroidetes bacterium]|nr:threonine--tRNA ligase [Bacteroidota bacterium]MBU1680049.1 threonine--tRNA ligase [Bacteroidota bacterium]MBU2505386.1 threonine--tRNA ligase [Bacteroidota bacterium]